MRFGPSRLMCNTNTGLQSRTKSLDEWGKSLTKFLAIYKARNISKSKVYATLLAQNGAWHVFNILDKERHAQKNRIMRQSLTHENLLRYEPVWIQQTAIFIDRLLRDVKESTWSAPRDIAYYGTPYSPPDFFHERLAVNSDFTADCMTMDIMGLVVFGRDLHLQSQPDNRYMIDVIASLQRWNSTHIQSPSLAKLHLDKLFYPQQLYYGSKLLEQVRIFVEERTEGIKQAKDDIFSWIVDGVDPETGEQMPLVELWSEAKLLLAASKSLERLYGKRLFPIIDLNRCGSNSNCLGHNAILPFSQH